MKIVDKVLDSLGLFEEEIESVEEVEAQARTEKKNRTDQLEPVRLNTSKSRRKKDRKNLKASGEENEAEEINDSSRILSARHVIVTSPKSFENVQEIADHMRDQRAVLLNFDNTDYESARRIVDFVSGVSYALDGTMKKIGQGVFLCTPHGMEVSYDVRSEFKGTDTSSWDDQDFERYFRR